MTLLAYPSLLRIIFWLLLSFILVPATAASANSEKTNTSTPKQQSRYAQRGTENAPLFVSGEVTTKKDKEEAREDAEERKIKTEVDAALVKYTGWLAFFTAFLFIFTAALWWVTLQLSRHAKKDSERQAIETQQSLAVANMAAQAAINGNELNRKSFISSQRPWVVVKEITPSSDLDLKSGLSFTFVVKNVGNSPGMNVDISAIMHLPHRGDAHQIHRRLREDRANERTKHTAAFENISFGNLLVPGEEIEITVRAENNPSDYQKAATMNPLGEIIILILGQVSYRFGIDESWHESGFMFTVRRRGGINVTLANGIVPIEQVEIKRFPAGFYAT